MVNVVQHLTHHNASKSMAEIKSTAFKVYSGGRSSGSKGHKKETKIAASVLLSQLMCSTGWRPVVAVFCNILFSCNRHIVFSDSIFWFNKLGVNVGILLLYFFK